MRIVHYYPTALDGSGVTLALWGWVHATRDAGVEVLVVSGAPSGERPWFDGLAGSAEVAYIEHRGQRRLTRYPVRLGRLLRPGDVLVLHEGWILANLVAARTARSLGVPFVVMPHGVYEKPWRSYLRGPVRLREAVEARQLRRAAAVHVFFEAEGEDVRALAPDARLIVAPTGFAVPDECWTPGGDYLAWVGRYDPHHKGLDLLVDAVAAIPEDRRPTIRLRGYDYRGGMGRLSAQVVDRGVGRWVEVGPAVEGPAKTEFLLGAAGYVHPSRWEAYGLALVEALALGMPVLASRTVQLAPELADADAALLTDLDSGSLADALERLGDASGQLGTRGRAFVTTRLSWDAIIPAYLDDLARWTSGVHPAVSVS